MADNHLVLAGGGHTHALILLRWCKNPHLRPNGMITLISRTSATIYSGMFPGLISGVYKYDDIFPVLLPSTTLDCSIDCETVTESNLSISTTLKWKF